MIEEDYRSAPLSPEVEWYLESRGYVLPEDAAVPLIRTEEPSPRTVPGAMFDPARVDKVIKALSALKHTKGRWAGRPLKPAAIQVAYIIAPIFGWVRPADGEEKKKHPRMVRIIREAYVEMPRKGAKTTLSSGLGVYLAFGDGEPGAEVIFGAASRDQAGQSFKPVAALVKASPMMQRAGVKARAHDIVQALTSSELKVVSSRGDLAHGANVHGALVDELHVHKNDGLLEAIETGTGARDQPLVMIITTADDGQTTTVYAEKRSYIERLAKGVLKSPSRYGVVFAASANDDPFAETTWKKCNPLYPETPSRAYMQAQAEKAASSPIQLESFLRLSLGIRSKASKAFFSLTKWDANASMVDELKIRGYRCYGGLDLATTRDITALVWLFPAEDGTYDVLPRFWVPEESLVDLDARTSRNASGWVQKGWLKVTPGDVTDYNFIKKQILKDSTNFEIDTLGYDGWNSSQLVLDLDQAGVPVARVPQTVSALSAPLKELERLVLRGTTAEPLLRHGGHPVLRWMADNTRVYQDSNGNIKPDKEKSTEKIDGISALNMAMALCMGNEDQVVDYGNLTVAGGGA